MKNLIIFFLALFAITSCETFEDPVPDIAWQSGSKLTYSYSGGALSGITATLNFKVISNFGGEVEFTAKNSDGEKSCSGYVEPGKDYHVEVVFSVSSSGSKGATTIDSPSVSDPFEIRSPDYKVVLKSISL